MERMLWLALICIALIALWGASEQWDIVGAGRRVAHSVHPGHEPDDPATSD